MTYENIIVKLHELADANYCQFSKKLIPNATNVLGIQVPKLRALAKELAKDDCTDFLSNCKFEIYEEILLYGILIASLKVDFSQKLALLDSFIPKIDNWAINDSVAMTLKLKDKDKELAREFILKHLNSQSEFELRFAIVLLFANFVDEKNVDFASIKLLEVSSEFYYVKMAVAWGLCECIVKFPDISIPQILASDNLDDFTFNKTVSKCCDSFRVSIENKALLKSKRR